MYATKNKQALLCFNRYIKRYNFADPCLAYKLWNLCPKRLLKRLLQSIVG